MTQRTPTERTRLLTSEHRLHEVPPLPLPYDAVPTEPLEQRSLKNRTRKRNLLIGGTLVLLVVAAFIGVNAYWIPQRSEELIQKSVDFQVQDVSLQGITTKGVDVRVKGVTSVDYNEIEESYYRNLFTIGGGLLRTASVTMDSVALETEVEGELVKMGSVDVPAIKVGISQGKKTPVDMVVSIHPDTARVVGLVKRLLTHPDEVLKVMGSTALKVALGGIPVGKFNVGFEEVISPNEYFDINFEDLTVKNVTVVAEEDEEVPAYDLSLMVSIPNPVKDKLVSFEVPKLHWSVMVNDCQGEPTIELLDSRSLTSHSFELSSLGDTLDVKISAYISEINDLLTKPCSTKHPTKTPLNTLINEFMSNNILPMRIKNVGGSKHYPAFLNQILTKNVVDFVYSPTSNSSFIHNTSLDNLGCDFLDGDFSQPVISGDVNIYISMPVTGLESGIAVQKARGTPRLFHSGQEFGQVSLNEWHMAENEFIEEDGVEYLHVSLTLDQELVEITDSGVFAGVVNEVLLGGGTKVHIKSLLDCVVETLIGELEIDDIAVENDSEIKIGSLFTYSV